MRVLITGGKGQLGRELQRAFALSQESEGQPSGWQGAGLKPGFRGMAGTDVLAPDVDELDVTDADAVERAVQQAKPDLVVHAAALTDTSRCEQDPSLAMRVNAQGSLNVAEACRRAGAGMVYISTNEVFDGAGVGHVQLVDVGRQHLGTPHCPKAGLLRRRRMRLRRKPGT